ncbi:MAG: histidine phosphatase family protein [Myxococcota bacterium]
MSDQTILTLIRHGETSANTEGVWHGSTDTPLSERGRRQAASVAEYLVERHPESAALYSSPLSRTHDTARAIGGRLELSVRIDPELVEFDLGRWEGKTYKELFETHELWTHMKRDEHFRPHGGESPRAVTDRLGGALRRIHDAHRGERVIVVTHGGALSMALAELLEGDYRRWGRVMANCAVSELVIEPEPGLLSFNLTDHLDSL